MSTHSLQEESGGMSTLHCDEWDEMVAPDAVRNSGWGYQLTSEGPGFAARIWNQSLPRVSRAAWSRRMTTIPGMEAVAERKVGCVSEPGLKYAIG